MTLTLRLPKLDDLAVMQQLAQDFPENGDFDWWGAPGTWEEKVQLFERGPTGENLPDGWVPFVKYLAECDGVVVGSVSVRFELNEYLHKIGGHIGYGVAKQHRGKGYAKQMLRQGLIVLRERGVDRALVTCFDDNPASAAVITGCGGILENTVMVDNRTLRRYWITL